MLSANPDYRNVGLRALARLGPNHYGVVMLGVRGLRLLGCLVSPRTQSCRKLDLCGMEDSSSVSCRCCRAVGSRLEMGNQSLEIELTGEKANS